MDRYIVLYRAPLEVAERFAQVPPEEAMKGVQLWIDWAARIGDGLVDPGRPLGNAMTVTQSGIAKTDTEIIGMSILQADSMESALKMVENHHHLYWADDCAITVLQEMPIPELEASHG